MNGFVDRRLAEPDALYAEHLARRRRALVQLFIALRPIDPDAPDLAAVRRIMREEDLLDALRYVAGPPVSKDDLGVLVTRRANRLTKRAMSSEASLATDVLKLICRLADKSRFRWLRERRRPSRAELRHAIESTAALQATQTVQTERRSYGRKVENRLRECLETLGYKIRPTPNHGKVTSPAHVPPAKTFYGECTFRGRRADLLIGLPDGRTVAVEAKDSSSVVNSVKRVRNDTAAKAALWGKEVGKDTIPVALLSGVFGVADLMQAQNEGLFLVWAHKMEDFTSWLEAQ